MFSFVVYIICILCCIHEGLTRASGASRTQVRLCRAGLFSPENGQIEELQEDYSGKLTSKFRCNPGYRMIGEPRMFCESNGNWIGKVPLCKSLCNFIECADGLKCILDEQFSTTRCVCKDIFECPFEYSPVCGSDRVTYANRCIMGMTACQEKRKVVALSNNSCPHEVLKDVSCGQCPKIKICQGLYGSEYAFLGELSGVNETAGGVFLTFNVLENYKGLEIEDNITQFTILRKESKSLCPCVPVIPSGKSYIFGKYSKIKGDRQIPLFDELTFVQKFYTHKQMNLCWLY